VQYAGSTALASSLPTVAGCRNSLALRLELALRGLWVTYLIHYTGSYTDPTIPGGVEVGKYVTHDIQLNCELGKLMSLASRLSTLKLSAGVNDLTYAKVPISTRVLGPRTHGERLRYLHRESRGRFFYVALHLDIPRH